MRQFVLLASVATVSAQMDMKALIGNLSPQCQAAAAGLMTSEFSTCSNLMGVVNILGATGSLLTPWNAWVDSICSIPPCSHSVVTAAANSIHGGCDTDAKKGVPAALEMTNLVSGYPTVRNALCIENKSNRNRCASDLLVTVEKAAGRPLTLMEVTGFLTEGVNSLSPVLVKTPKESICNDCTHGLVTVLSSPSSMPPMASNSSMASMPMPAKTTPETSGASSFKTGATAMCGPSFNDGKIPDTISVSNSPSPSPTDQPKSPANTGAPNAASSMATPVFTFLAILATATTFTILL